MTLPLHWEGIKLPIETYAFLKQHLTKPSKLNRCHQKKLAVIIPYRNRKAHLAEMIPLLTQALSQQLKHYSIFVVEQIGDGLFNKGKLMNAAVDLIGDDFDYFCFHDVDFVPLSVDYRYAELPVRPYTYTIGDKVYPKEFNHSKLERILHDRLPPLPAPTRGAVYPHLFGGVIIISQEGFKKVEGFCEAYDLWGYEDLDFLLRCLSQDLWPFYDPEGTFRLLPHRHTLKQLPPKEAKALVLENEKHYNAYAKQLKFSAIRRGYSLVETKHFPDYVCFQIK